MTVAVVDHTDIVCDTIGSVAVVILRTFAYILQKTTVETKFKTQEENNLKFLMRSSINFSFQEFANIG